MDVTIRPLGALTSTESRLPHRELSRVGSEPVLYVFRPDPNLSRHTDRTQKGPRGRLVKFRDTDDTVAHRSSLRSWKPEI